MATDSITFFDHLNVEKVSGFDRHNIGGISIDGFEKSTVHLYDWLDKWVQ